MARSKAYRLDPRAWQEIEAAEESYRQRSVDASAEYLVAVSEALEKISRTPRRWPKYLHGTRRFLLHRFPFFIVYIEEPEVVSVVAVAHSKRTPGYWKQRL